MPQHLAGVYEHQRSCVSSQRGREENTSAQFTRCMSFHHRAAHQSDLTQLCYIVLKPNVHLFLELIEDVSTSDGKPAFIHVLYSFQLLIMLQIPFLSLSLRFCKIRSDVCLYTKSATSIWGCCCSELAQGFCFFLLKVRYPDPPECSDQQPTGTADEFNAGSFL